MKANWEYKKIEEIAEKIGMGPFGSSIKVETFVSKGIPIVSGQHLHGNRLEEEVGFNFITEEHADRLKNSNVYRGDIIFTHAGNIGNVAYIPPNSKYERYIASQRQFYLRCNLQKAIPSFITYYFKSPEGQHRLKANSSSVGVPSIAQPVTYLRKLSIPIPPLPEQRAIAEVLSSLDDKIELNRRMNRTLKEFAKTHYRHHFLENPDYKNWKSIYLNEIAAFIKGVSYRSEDLVDNATTAMVTLKSIERGGGYKDEGLKPFIGKFKPEQQLIEGDLVIAHTDLTQLAEVIGRAARIESSEKYPNLVASLDLVIVRPKNDSVSNDFLYCLLAYSDFPEYSYGYINGTTVLHLSPSALQTYQFRKPPEKLIKSFSSIVQPIFSKIFLQNKESRSLTEIRDILLPKLVSGQIRLKGSY